METLQDAVKVNSNFEAYLTKRARARPNTILTYRHSLEYWLRWLLASDAHEPSPDNAQEFLDWLEERGKSANTVNVHAIALRKWFKWQNIDAKLSSPGVEIGEPEYVTPIQLESLLEHCKTELERVLITLLFDTACRISEILNIHTNDIDWKSGLLTVTRKGGRVAQVNISEKGMKELRAWMNKRTRKSERVFMDYQYIDAWRVIKDVGIRAGIRIHPHMLRHSRAIQMLSSGTEMHIVQQHLGHTRIGTTMDIYGRLKPMDLKDKIPAW